jgi:hypothetical protein
MDKDYLILKRALVSRLSSECNDDGFDVLANNEIVGDIFKANAAPVGSPWMWMLAFGHYEDRSPTYGYGETRGRRWRHSPRVGAPILKCFINATA